jgi:hypothetical protein
MNTFSREIYICILGNGKFSTQKFNLKKVTKRIKNIFLKIEDLIHPIKKGKKNQFSFFVFLDFLMYTIKKFDV